MRPSFPLTFAPLVVACALPPPPRISPAAVALVERVCAAAPCSGELARVTLWQTAAGQLAVAEHAGDIRVCSHPPTTFYDAEGQQLDTIPLKPVVPGSAEALQFTAIREKQTRGLLDIGTYPCAEPQ